MPDMPPVPREAAKLAKEAAKAARGKGGFRRGRCRGRPRGGANSNKRKLSNSSTPRDPKRGK